MEYDKQFKKKVNDNKIQTKTRTRVRMMVMDEKRKGIKFWNTINVKFTVYKIGLCCHSDIIMLYWANQWLKSELKRVFIVGEKLDSHWLFCVVDVESGGWCLSGGLGWKRFGISICFEGLAGCLCDLMVFWVILDSFFVFTDFAFLVRNGFLSMIWDGFDFVWRMNVVLILEDESLSLFGTDVGAVFSI